MGVLSDPVSPFAPSERLATSDQLAPRVGPERSVSDTSQGPGSVLVLNFGAQYAQLIARRVREAQVFSEIVPGTLSAMQLAARRPAALILSGGPSSVYEAGAPQCDPAIFDLDIPILGICYGHQLMAQCLGASVTRGEIREYGRTPLVIEDDNGVLLPSQPSPYEVWMSHADAVVKPPKGFVVTGSTNSTPVAAMEDVDRSLYGLQFHPEVSHTPGGQSVLERFLFKGARVKRNWRMDSLVESRIKDIREQVGGETAICALSGGVDSAVAAALVHRAIGDRLTCVFVDHGLMRKGEREQVAAAFQDRFGSNFKQVLAAEEFLGALDKAGQDPEKKRKAIGRTFIELFERVCHEELEDSRFLVQGTIYPDWIESGGNGTAAGIKSHHNVGGLPEEMNLQLIEPLRDLFKDEVRKVGNELGLPDEIVKRHPFPGPGLAVRIVGRVTHDRLELLREADAIAREELTNAGLDEQVWQLAVVLLADVRSVGVQGDGRTYGHPVVLRPVDSEDAMTADWSRLPHDLVARISTRITNEVDGVNRVVLDVTSKPPATIEWE